MSDNPYAAPGAEPDSAGNHAVAKPSGTDDPFGVAKVVIEDVKANPVGYFLAGLGYFAFVMMAVVVILGALFLSMLPGLVTENEGLLVGGGIIGMAIYVAGILGLSFGIAPLQMASMIRALDAQMRGEGAIGFMSLVDTMRKDAVRIILFYLFYQTTVLVGVIFLYVPGIVAAVLGSFVMPILCLEEDVGIMDAYSRGWEHLKANIGWHFGVWLSMFVALIFLEITLVGLFVLMPVMCAWQVAAYRMALAPEGQA